jgi:D-glycero-D-manno-heptose 1,7-bisphosphate phosphatase
MSLNSLRRTRKILFLDRDDTIIKDHGYLNDPGKVQILEGVAEALKIFRDHGFEFIVTTNQSGLTRKLVQIENLNLIHQKIQFELNKSGIRILDFYSAPYSHDHKRRKPGWGLTQNAMSDYSIDIKNSIFAGDKWRDLHVGFEFGSKTILVNEAKDQGEYFKDLTPSLVIKSWTEFNDDIFRSLFNGTAVKKSNKNIKAGIQKAKNQQNSFKNQ